MRKVLLALSVSLLSSSLFGQDSLLKKFKFRISNYKAIALNAGGGNQYYRDKFVTGNNTSSALSGSLSAAGEYIKSTDRILLYTSAGLSSAFTGSKNNNSTAVNRQRAFIGAAYLTALNKWFKKDFFTELGIDLSNSFNSGKSGLKNAPPSYHSQNHQESLAINLGIGKGRLENITGMQNALWLYKTLADDNKLSQNASADNLNGLGMIITQANNTRILDSRKKRQYVLQSLDKYLQEKGMISQTDIGYFADLNDILFFAFNEPRLSGTEKFIRLTPGIRHADSRQVDNNSSSKYDQSSKLMSAFLQAGINKYLSISLRRQFNWGASLFLNYFSQHYTEKNFVSGVLTNLLELSSDARQAGISAFATYAIYPNTRTIVSLALHPEAGYQKIGPGSDIYANIVFSGTLNYFISYRTRFKCNTGANYLRNVHSFYAIPMQVPDNLSFFANAGIEISL